ncbi:MAG TPA: hypothetical protein PLH06_07300, partial [Candidatus Hydrogenedentes bacterium]|nr:hypothetical protein [Candidatus Hydrogenedentota bacterium]
MTTDTQDTSPWRAPGDTGAGSPCPDSPPCYAGVVFPIPVDQVFTYAVPPPLRDRVRPGMRAVATLKSRVVTGFVVEVSHESPVADVIPLVDLPDGGTFIISIPKAP